MQERWTWALVDGDEELVGTRVRLRGLQPADCTERYAGWLNDPEVTRYLEVGQEPEDVESVLAYVRSVAESPMATMLAVVDVELDRHVGNVKVAPVEVRHRCGHVSYVIGDREAWGRGVASEAVRMAVDAAFERLDLHRLEAGVHAGNGASRTVLERAGMELEGRLVERLRVGDEWDDHLLYGVVVDRWRAGRR